MRIRLFPLVAFLLSLLLQAADGEVRLAILSDTECRDQESLLTAALSHAPVTVLERTEISRVLAEQHLAAAGVLAEQLPRLGRLLGADGLVFLTAGPGKDSANLSCRIVAVHPGVVIASDIEPNPKDVTAWSQDTAGNIVSLLPKLAVREEAAIPVSVVNLRATRNRPEAQELERELTLLLAHRLAHEPTIFVLERDRLEALQNEKPSDATDPFWTGRWLIDGSIEQDLSDADHLSIAINLQAANGAAPVTMHLQGRHEDAVVMVDRLATEITRRLQQEPTATPWSADREAAQFWRDAQWAFAQEVFPRAALAAEAAWVLGSRTPEVMALRTRAELLAARPNLVIEHRYPSEYVAHFLQDRNFFWRADLPITRGYRTAIALRELFNSMSQAEREKRLEQTLHGVELYRDHFSELAAQTGLLGLANETLAVGGAMLEWFQQNDLRDADARVDELAACLRDIDLAVSRGLAEISRDAKPEEIAELWFIRTALTPIWSPSADATLTAWRAALHAPIDAESAAILRVTLVHAVDLYPALTAKTEHNRFLPDDHSSKTTPPLPPTPKEWPAFVEELCASSFAGDRFTGLCLQYAATPRDESAEIADKSQAEFWDQRAAFARADLPFRYWDLLRSRYSKGDGLPFAGRFLIYLLNESTPIEQDALWELFQPRYLLKEEAAPVYEAVLAHNARVRQKFGSHWILSDIHDRTEELLLRFPELRRAAPAGDGVEVTRYWQPYRLLEFQAGAPDHFKLDFRESIYAEGRLWLFAATPFYRFIFGINLKTFETETIPFPNPPPLATPFKARWGGFNLSVASDYIYVCGEATLSRYDRKAKTWHYYPQLPGVMAQPWRVGNRLYVQVNNSTQGIKEEHFGEMIELDVKTDAVTLLASDRRQPPSAPLDTWAFAPVTVRTSPSGQVFFRAYARKGEGIYNYAAYDPSKREWGPLKKGQWNAAAPSCETAYEAMASGDAPWKITASETAGGGWQLASAQRTIPFRCKLSELDRAQLAKNGPSPSFASLESNINSDLASAPLVCVTPDGIAISHDGQMPGFWFIPNEDLPPIAEKP